MDRDGSPSGWRGQPVTRGAAHRFARGLLAALVLISALPLLARAQPVKTPHVIAELVAERSAIEPGQSLQIGLRLQHEPHWHTYWRNPGDSGLPTSMRWTLPFGAEAGDIEWPAPKRLPIGPLVNFGYEGEVLLPLVFTAPPRARPGSTLTLQADARWLVCKDVCIPESAVLTLVLPVVGGAQSADGITAGSTAHSALFERTRNEQPVPIAGWTVDSQLAGSDLLVSFARAAGTARSSGAPPVVHVFPYAEQLVDTARHELFRTDSGYAVRFRLLDGVSAPTTLSGIAVAQLPSSAGALTGTPTVWGGDRRAVEFDSPVRTVAALTMPAGAAAFGDSAQSTDSSAPVSLMDSAPPTWLGALLLAFVGGMLLNLMPCVFPVLSIKLLSLTRNASPTHTSPQALRLHAAAYAAGVVLSFLALAGALLALRAAGSAIGWGFQLQEPAVIFVLAMLFFAIGLNLIGVFEFAGLLPSALATWRDERPAVDAAASGVLAVVAASPCTAPFMGAALGYAITQSWQLALSVFAALGLGMALPYALLVLLPGWRSRLPRPGPWMLHLKQALAFPMFLTVVWLVWVLGQQAGMDGAARALVAMVALAFGLWILGLRTTTPAARARWMSAAALLLSALGLAWGWTGATSAVASSVNTESAVAIRDSGAEAAWQPYDEDAIARHLAEGRPVFVDFTAAWCVSCQVNKRLVLHTDTTMQDFARAKVVLMRADWTQRDERITRALARLGRNGVPVYVLMRPDREPLLLPEILTQGLVRDALSTLSVP
jgi:thiol:disulfide interchange protein DsbD